MFTKRHTLHLSIQLILSPSCFLLIISPSYCKPNSFSQGILSYSVLLCGIYLHVTITWKIYFLFFFLHFVTLLLGRILLSSKYFQTWFCDHSICMLNRRTFVSSNIKHPERRTLSDIFSTNPNNKEG